jgi:hypothetical protein
LRLPGFLNRKYETEFLVQAEKHTDRVEHLQDFRLRTEPIDGDFRPRHHSQTLPSSGPRLASQSEHDWAFAKRALARGDDPETVIRRIADYRSDEKHDPQYYARYTVQKAQAELQSRRAMAQPAENNSVLTNESSREK